MPNGTVRWFDPDRGFGFLAPEDESPDVFVHAKEILGDGPQRVLREGQAVEFTVGEGERGPQALGVRVTGDVAATAALGLLGTMSWYEPGKGYGFASPDGGGAEVFVHSSAIVTGGVLAEGQRVAFLVVAGEKGPQAQHVLPLGGTAGRPAASDGADGTVTWYDEGKGFGFVTPDAGGEDVFVHIRAIADGVPLVEGDRVAYEVVAGDKGPQARDLYLVTPDAAAPSTAPAQLPPARSERPSQQRSAPARGGRPAAGGPPARGGEGVVARYDSERGFGFVTPDAGGADLFMHISVIEGAEGLEAGDRVSFGVRQSDRGPQADKVKRL